MLPIGRVRTRYRITLEVTDQPGVLATIARVLSDGGVSVEAVQQSAGVTDAVPTANLVIGTHEAAEDALAATVRVLSASEVVSSVTSVLRVEGS